MLKRKSHTKSRNGCTNCKRKHVKCDELGPPCANCIAREISQTCSYTAPSNSQRTTPSSSSLSAASPGLTSEEKKQHALELELMHRWTSSTYKSLCSLPEDHVYLQNEVPLWGFKSDYILQGVFSLAALEIVLCGGAANDADPVVYFQTALDCYGKGSRLFREKLAGMTSDDVHVAYIFAAIATAITLAIPECGRAAGCSDHDSMLERMSVFSEMIVGSTSVALMYPEALLSGPLEASLKKALEIMAQEIPEQLDDETDAALRRLSTIVKDMFPSSEDELTTRRRQVYLDAVENLRTCFHEDIRGTIKGFAISFPSLAGPEFLAYMKNLEPLAILILMHWGVLLENVGQMAWWARSVGKNMVSEVSETLLEPSLGFRDKQDWWDGISWARKKVGLPEITK